MPSQPSSTSRRRFLRRLGGVAALGIAASTAGCTSRVVSSGGGGAGAFDRADLDAATFDEYLDATRERYGNHGVFGLRDPPDDASFVNAWVDRFTTGDDDGLARADYAVARYHLGKSGAGDRMDAWVLWAAARPMTETTHLPPLPGGYEPEAAVRVRGLGLHVDFGAPADLVYFDPNVDLDASETDEYTALSGSQSGTFVASTVPLETGVVRPTPPRTWDFQSETGFDRDDYTVGWQGRAASPVSATAICTTALSPDADPGTVAPEIRFHVAAGGYLFA
jgi:hypothetical protein